MTSLKPRTVLYRRKRQKKTDYKRRLRLLLSRKPRVLVRVTNKSLIAQVVQFSPKGDLVIAGMTSAKLKEQGWPYSLKNMPAAYLTGLLLGKMAVHKGCREAVMDTGFRTPIIKGRIYAFLKGLLDGGLVVDHSTEIFSSDERLVGRHIASFAKEAKGKQQFAQYLKSNIQPERMEETFLAVKKKILGT